MKKTTEQPAAKAIKTLRQGGMSYAQIAARLLVGEQSVRRWEVGSHAPTPGSLERLKSLAGEGLAK